jgi:hypothetical protein
MTPQVTFAVRTVGGLLGGIVTTTRATYGPLQPPHHWAADTQGRSAGGGAPSAAPEVSKQPEASGLSGPLVLDRGSKQAQPEGLRPVAVRCSAHERPLRELRGVWGLAWEGVDRLEAVLEGAGGEWVAVCAVCVCSLCVSHTATTNFRST